MLLETLQGFVHSMGIANLGYQNAIMIVVSFVFL